MAFWRATVAVAVVVGGDGGGGGGGGARFSFFFFLPFPGREGIENKVSTPPLPPLFRSRSHTTRCAKRKVRRSRNIKNGAQKT